MAECSECFLEVAGCRVRVMRGGEGPILLFLHGSGGASVWTPFMQDLSERFHLIVPEHPGFGDSDRPVWLKGVSDLAYFYLDFIETQRLGDLYLAGNSLGGWIAAEIAIRNSSRLRALTLISPGGLDVDGDPPGNIFEWPAGDFARNMFADASFAAIYEQQVMAMDPARVAKNNAAMETIAKSPLLCNPQLGPWLHRIATPTLIVWGDCDKVFPVSYAARFQQSIPGCGMKIIPDCGHLPHVEKRGAVVELILDFISNGANS